MSETNKNSHSGFKYGITGLSIFLVLIILTAIINTFDFYFLSLLIGLLVLIIGCIGIIGLTKSLKGLKEPNTLKKVIGIVINFGIVGLFVSAIIANFLDMYKAFS
ncbi:hypothetical protein [Aquimarina sp. LLG6339-5]|uniref:hypothetical protein n=1 Tax=Aquimarina sp. LLG6339-5 TaxID=3160830 RepID=UPI00386B971E